MLQEPQLCHASIDDEPSLPDGINPFVSIQFDARELCTAISPSLANSGNRFVGLKLAEICNPLALAGVRTAADQMRQLKRPVLGISIHEYFLSAFSLDGFATLSLVTAADEAIIHIVQNLTALNQAVTAFIPAKQRLSFRESQVIECIARGFTSKQIASTLGLSVFTVGNYRKQILKKLDLHTTADLVAFWFSTYRFVIVAEKAIAEATR